MDIENDRVRSEEQDRAQREAREQAARQRQHLLEIEAERQRVTLEAQRQTREQMKREQETARLAMIKEAAIVKSRIEVEAQAAREALHREAEHAARLASLADRSRRWRSRLVLIGSNGVLVVLLSVMAGAVFGQVIPEGQRREGQLRELAATAGDRADAADRLARQAAGKVSDLEKQLARTLSELGEARSKNEKLSTQVEPALPGPPPEQGRGDAPATEDREKSRCASEWDPMCDVL